PRSAERNSKAWRFGIATGAPTATGIVVVVVSMVLDGAADDACDVEVVAGATPYGVGSRPSALRRIPTSTARTTITTAPTATAWASAPRPPPTDDSACGKLAPSPPSPWPAPMPP